jgi:hypothetical protein
MERYTYIHEDHNIRVSLSDWRDNPEARMDEKWGAVLGGKVSEHVVEHLKQTHYYERYSGEGGGEAYSLDFTRGFETKREAEEFIKAMCDALQAVLQVSDMLENQGRTTASMMTVFIDSDQNDLGMRIGAEVTHHDYGSDLVRSLLNKRMSLHRVEYYGSGIFDVIKGAENVSEEVIEDFSSRNFNAKFDMDEIQEEMEDFRETQDDRRGG